MARIRTIKPKTFDDSKLSKVSRDARLLYIATWCYSDDLGVILADPIWLKSKIFPFDQIQLNQFMKWLTELRESGFISLFSHKGEEFYYLPNFSKHQVINRPNYDDVFVKKTVLESILRNSLNIHGTISDQSPPERKGKEITGKEVSESFTPPVFDEVFVFFKEKANWDLKKAGDQADAFLDYYGRTDWKTKNGPIKNWQNAASGWIRSDPTAAGAGKNGLTSKKKKSFPEVPDDDYYNDLNSELRDLCKRQWEADGYRVVWDEAKYRWNWS
jgi:hypothetical protein